VLFRDAAAIEKLRDIVRAAHDQGVKLRAASGFESVTGTGVKGTVDGQDVALSNTKLMRELGISCLVTGWLLSLLIAAPSHES
jgi:cation transport ATPase